MARVRIGLKRPGPSSVCFSSTRQTAEPQAKSLGGAPTPRRGVGTFSALDRKTPRSSQGRAILFRHGAGFPRGAGSLRSGRSIGHC